MEFNSLFKSLRPNYQLEYLITKRKKKECNICYASRQNLPWFKFIFLLPENGKDTKMSFCNRNQCNLRSVALSLLHGRLQVPYWKLCGLLTQTSIFSTSYRLWLDRRKAFYRYCSPRSLFFNDTWIVRNLYPKKFHSWCKSKKLSRDLLPTWWEFSYDHFWL